MCFPIHAEIKQKPDKYPIGGTKTEINIEPEPRIGALWQINQGFARKHFTMQIHTALLRGHSIFLTVIWRIV